MLEVRHASWLIDPVFERLAHANVALCLHDWKEQPVTGPVTADFVYVRPSWDAPSLWRLLLRAAEGRDVFVLVRSPAIGRRAA